MENKLKEISPDLRVTENNESSAAEIAYVKEPGISTTGSLAAKAMKYAGAVISVTEARAILRDRQEADGLMPSIRSLTEGNFIKPWKNIGNINAKILDIYDDVVLLECLVDRESKQYAEFEFSRTLFSAFDIKVGGYCVISKYQRDSALQLEINANPSMDLSIDFPTVEWVRQFKNSPIFKKS
jgi:hypothetical protein